MTAKRPEIEAPEEMRDLPLTDKGYLKPWFVEADDFRIVDKKKAWLCINKHACWICGKAFHESVYALVGSPLSAMFRQFREPPCHPGCAEYAMQICPFLLYPNAKRRTAGLEHAQTMDYVNNKLDSKFDPENPGEFYLVLVKRFTWDEQQKVIRCEESDILERQFWIEGKKQSSHPDPIVPFSGLPDNVKKQLLAKAGKFKTPG